MYIFLSLFIGIIISIMVAINGQLTTYYGMFISAIIIHIVGSVFAYIVIKFKKQSLQLDRAIPLCFYLGGILGVVTTFCNNFAFGKISLTSIIALGLLGQTVTSLLIDSFGLFGMKKYPFQKYTLIGLSLALLGMIMMVDSPALSGLLAVIFSFIAGISIVLSRTFNARLSQQTGALQSSFINHLVGLPICVILFLFLDTSNFFNLFSFSYAPWIYLGGILGVVTVLLFNFLVPKIASLPLTILSFIGQIFTSMLLDLVLLHTYDFTTFSSGLVIALGIGINIFLSNKHIHK